MFYSFKKLHLEIIFKNILILILFILIPPSIYKAYTKARSIFHKDVRAYYPTYSDKKFGEKIFNEFSNLSTEYRSFIGWKRKNISLEFTTIKNPYMTRLSSGESIKNSAWFFGGSTMWGTGSSNNQTIPSIVNSISKISVFNFAESGWTSRQSLNQLINLIYIK